MRQGSDPDSSGDGPEVVLSTLTRTYNQLGQLEYQQDAYGNVTRYTYDANGTIDTVTDALGRVTDHDHDALNRLTRTTRDLNGLNVTTDFAYDAHDHLTEVTDPNGHTTKYTWNGLGDLTRLASPDTGITTYTHDEAGNRTSQTDARGITTRYTYDALNRLTSTRYPDSTLDITYEYDTAPTACAEDETFAVHHLSRITDASGDTQFCYDRFGNLTRKVQTTAGQTHTIRYAYTKADALSSIEYPDGTRVDYVRNPSGRITEVGIARPGQARETLLTAVGYYPFGPPSEWVFGKTRLFQRTLNRNYQPGIVQDQNPGGLSLGYEFDPAGNLMTLRTGDQTEPPLRTYGYDALNRLTQARDGATDTPLHAYTYDPTGNRTSSIEDGVTTPYTIDRYSHHLLAAGNEPRTYDPNGNTTAIGTARTFVHNDANRLSEASHNGQTATYRYNGKGEQVLRRSGGRNTVFLYDETGHWLGEYDSSGHPLQQIVWIDDLPVGLIIGPPAANEPLHYIEADALGSPRVVINSRRDAVVWEWALTGEAFGKDPPNEDPDGDGTPLVFDMRFPGQRYDSISDLSYNRNRDYESATGRHPTSDPAGQQGGINTYSYANNSPFTWLDPDGLQAASAIYPGYYPLGTSPVPGPRPLLWPGVGGFAGCLNPITAGILLMMVPGNIGQDASCSDDPLKKRQECRDDDEECAKRLEREETLCRLLAGPRYPGDPERAIRICQGAAFQRYAACLRGTPETQWPPHTGIDTPI